MVKKDHLLTFIILGCSSMLTFSCVQNADKKKMISMSGDLLYIEARKNLIDGNRAKSMDLLKKAFNNGKQQPMQIVRDTILLALVDDPEYRPDIRSLIQRYSNENKTILVADREQGERIIVSGQILDEEERQPMRNVDIELIQADAHGLYFNEKSLWNPRLFAYLKTDSLGKFSVQTIRPGVYLDDDGNEVPSHIHFNLQAKGFRTYHSEFSFEDDERILKEGNVDNVPIARIVQTGSEKLYHVTIYMQKE